MCLSSLQGRPVTDRRLCMTVNFHRRTCYQSSGGSSSRSDAVGMCQRRGRTSNVPRRIIHIPSLSPPLLQSDNPINLLIQETLHPKTYLQHTLAGNLRSPFTGSSVVSFLVDPTRPKTFRINRQARDTAFSRRCLPCRYQRRSRGQGDSPRGS